MQIAAQNVGKLKESLFIRMEWSGVPELFVTVMVLVLAANENEMTSSQSSPVQLSTHVCVTLPNFPKILEFVQGSALCK